MAYEIKQKYITSTNRPKKALAPQGIVIHSTATPGAPAINIRDYFANHPEAKASAHAAIDWTTIIEIIPANEKAWHAGPTANNTFLGIELCEPKEHDPAKFAEVWNRAVWYAAKACKQFGWDPSKIYSHDEISKMFHETNHTDPTAFFAGYGKVWGDFKLAVMKELKGEDKVTVDEALKILAQHEVMGNPEYWKQAAGVVKYLDNLLINMASKLKEGKYNEV